MNTSLLSHHELKPVLADTTDKWQSITHMDLDQASLYMGTSKSTLYKRTANRKIPFSKPLGKLIFLKADLDQYILENRVPQRSQTQFNNLKFNTHAN